MRNIRRAEPVSWTRDTAAGLQACKQEINIIAIWKFVLLRVLQTPELIEYVER